MSAAAQTTVDSVSAAALAPLSPAPGRPAGWSGTVWTAGIDPAVTSWPWSSGLVGQGQGHSGLPR